MAFLVDVQSLVEDPDGEECGEEVETVYES